MLGGTATPTSSSGTTRLAINFDPDKLKTSLILAFQLLERPVTAEGVIRWKQQVLDLEGDLSERGFEDPDTGDSH